MKNFCKNFCSVLRTTGLIFKVTPGNLPAYIGQRLLLTLRPFVVLYFSARILDLLVQGCGRQQILCQIAVAVGCSYGMYLLAQMLAGVQSVEDIDMYWKFHEKMSETAMDADYKELEQPQMMQDMMRIVQAARMYRLGPWEAATAMLKVLEGIVVVGSAVVLTIPVFSKAHGTAAVWEGLIFGGIVAGGLLHAVYSEKKLYRLKAVSLDEVALEYRISEFCGTYAARDCAAKDVRLYGQQGVLKEYMHHMLKAVQKHVGKSSYEQAKSNGIQAAFSQLIALAAYMVVGIQAMMGILSVGGIVQYVGALTRLSGGVRTLAYSLQYISMQGPHCQEYLDFIGKGEEGKKYEHEADGEEAVRDMEGSVITFEHVSYRYPGADSWALRDVNVSLRKGEHLAVVGQNGSGKTTFIKLLCRLLKPTEGRILYNGKDIWEFRKKDYWGLFSVVFQDFRLFALPLGENIAVGVSYDGERVLKCLGDAGIREWAEGLPRKLEQPLFREDQDGIDVSGGEAQKLAIARALYKDAPFVLMDEPTAALDAVAEAEIYGKLNQMIQGKGAIYISHRLSSCHFCDRIAVFKEGRMIQYASHRELLEEKDGEYYLLWNTQAQYYL